MGVTITEIELKNYRQYKNTTISFSKNNESNLHVLKAKNGTGKTTFINSITWCLYGEEKYINNADKALNLPNEKTIENTEENGFVEVSVRITLNDDDSKKSIVFARKQRYRVNFNVLHKSKKTIQEPQKFTIAITNLFDAENSKIIDDPIECEQFVNTYFNKSIYDYYFFDGENLKNYFTKSKTETIQNSIFNISQVTLLENSKKRTNDLAIKKSRELNRKNPDEVNYYEEKNRLENEINAKIETNKKLETEIIKFSELKAKADDILNNYTPIKVQQKRKQELENYLNKNTKSLTELRNRQYAFIQDYMVLLRFYPRIKKTYEMICYKEAHKELPPNINKKEIKEIVDHHLKNCPVCNSEIDDDAIVYLQKLLDDTSVSTGTSHQLMLIKSSLEEMMEKTLKFKEEKDKLLNDEKNIKRGRKEI